jgi:hypothetical protein
MAIELARKGAVYRNSTESERRLRLYGVPTRYWKTEESDITGFTTVTCERDWGKSKSALQLDPDGQRRTVASIFEGTALRDTSRVVVVGSEPTDDMGLVFGSAVVRRAIAMGLRPLMLSITKDPQRTEISQVPDVVVLWNVRGDSTQGRIDSSRDWLARFDDSYRILIVAGMNPAYFYYTKLHWQPDAALYFRGEYDGGQNQ